MTRTVTHLYDSHAEASRAVQTLEQAGIAPDAISIVAGDRTGGHVGAEFAAEAGASVGTLVGGGAGLLAGIGAMAIPGIGPVVAAGWLIAMATGAGVGAAAGGLVGALVGVGHGHREAHVYAEGVRRGGVLLSVRADEAEVQRVEGMLEHTGGHADLAAREAEYRAAGWQPEPVSETPAGIGSATEAGRPVGDPASGSPKLTQEEAGRQRLGSATHA